MKKLKKTLIILVLLAIGPIEILYLAPLVDEKLGTVEVIQATKDIPRGQVITNNDVKTVRMKTSQAVKDRMTEPSEIVGQETTRPIRENEVITADMLVLDRLTPNHEQYNMPMPPDWVLSAPGSLLRGDSISLVPVYTQPTRATVEDEDVEQSRTVIQPTAEEIALLSNILISYSKSNNNQEVTTEDDERKNPSGQVNRFEMIVTEQQRDIIIKFGNNRFKFLVTYR